jgi:hypothetical protein
MSDRTLPISAPSLAPGTTASAPAAAARTKLLLEGPILPTLLRPARVRRRHHVRRILSRAHRQQCTRGRLASVSLGDVAAMNANVVRMMTSAGLGLIAVY